MKSFRAPASPIRPRFYVFLGFLALIALAGGAARVDEPAHAVTRVGAVAYMAWLSWTLSTREVRRFAIPLAILAAIALIGLVQLVPLPPGLWTAMPGRAAYADAAAAAGISQPWRPVALVPDRCWNAVLGLLTPVAALLGLSGFNMAERARLLPAFLVLTGVSLLIAATQFAGTGTGLIGWYRSAWQFNASGLFTNRNHQALLIAIAIPALAVWTAEPRSGGRERMTAPARLAFCIAGFAGLIVMLFATGSRAGLLWGAIGFVLALVLTGARMRTGIAGWRSRTRRLMGWMAALTVALFAVLLFLLRDSEALRRLMAMDPTQDPRVRAWRGAAAMTGEMFPFGTGMGAFEFVFRRYELPGELTYESMNQVHSEPFAAVVEMGLPGLLLVLAIAAAWVWAARRAWRPDGSTLQRLGVGALLLVGLATTVDYPTRTPLMAVLCAMYVAWAAPRPLRQSSGSLRASTGPGADRHGFTVPS